MNNLEFIYVCVCVCVGPVCCHPYRVMRRDFQYPKRKTNTTLNLEREMCLR